MPAVTTGTATEAAMAGGRVEVHAVRVEVRPALIVKQVHLPRAAIARRETGPAGNVKPGLRPQVGFVRRAQPQQTNARPDLLPWADNARQGVRLETSVRRAVPPRDPQPDIARREVRPASNARRGVRLETSAVRAVPQTIDQCRLSFSAPSVGGRQDPRKIIAQEHHCLLNPFCVSGSFGGPGLFEHLGHDFIPRKDRLFQKF